MTSDPSTAWAAGIGWHDVEARATPPGWYADPLGRFEYRYFNGVQWTSDVALDGRRYVDSSAPAAPDRSPGELAPRRTRGMALAAFINGLGGVLVGWVPFVFVLAVGAAIAAIVFGVIGLQTASRQDGYGRGFAVAGLALAPIALAVCVGGFFFTRLVLHEVSDFIDPGPHRLVVDQPCTVTDGEATLRGTIRNLDIERHDYHIYVEITSATDSERTRVAVLDVAPGAIESWTASAPIAGTAVTCEVTDVFGPMPFDVEGS